MPRSASGNCPALNIDIDKPRWDQSTYWGRARYFMQTVSPMNILVLPSTLNKARERVVKYRRGDSDQECLTEAELWKAKKLYDSAFHPDTGEKMFIIGRMSAQVPMNTLIIGGMMLFYKHPGSVIFWHWVNQSFNATVNYNNRAGDAAISTKQLLVSYFLATTGSIVTALSLNHYTKNLPPIWGRLVPFMAIAAANCVNLPIMRYEEISNGTPIYDDTDKRVGKSRRAAAEGIIQVIFSRILMPSPGMVLTPLLVTHLERTGVLAKYPQWSSPMQVFFIGFCLTFATPLCCAIFDQNATIPYSRLEPHAKEQVNKYYGSNPPKTFHYNKGL